jgi:hypothetical protein
LVITTTVRADLRHEKIAPLGDAPRWVERLPQGRLRRALLIGLVCLLVLGPPAAAILSLVDYGDITVGEFVVYKAIVGVVLGAIVTPPIALAAMRDGWRADAP